MEKKKMSKKKKIIIAVIILFAIIVLGGGIYFAAVVLPQKMEELQKGMEGSADDGLYKASGQDVKQEIIASGTTVGIDRFVYTSPVTSSVEDVRVEAGQIVKKGDILMTYDAEKLGDELYKVQIQARSEKASGNASYEQVSDAKAKVDAANKRIAEITPTINQLKNDITKLSALKVIYEKAHGIYEEEDDDKDKGANQVSVGLKEEGTSGDPDATTEKPASTIPTEIAGTRVPTDAEYAEICKMLITKQELLAGYQEELAKQKGIVEANSDAKVSASAAAQIQAANELSDMSVNEAQKTYDKAQAGIVAEQDGIVESVDVIKGGIASEGQALFTIIDANKVGVEFSISKDNISSVREGQKAGIIVGDKTYTGSVDFVSHIAMAEATGAGSSTSSIKGRVVIDDPDDDLFIGVSAKVHIFIGEAKDVLAVPYTSVGTDVDGDFVYIVNKNNIIERRNVKTGIKSEEYYEILEGLEKGDKVVREITVKIKEGEEYVPPTVNPLTGMAGIKVIGRY